VGVLLFTQQTQAQSAAEFRRAKQRVEMEPTVNDTVRRSLDFFRVSPEHVQALRDTARARGVLPLLAVGYRYENNSLDRAINQIGTTTFNQNAADATAINSFTVGAVWDLRELMMNPAEIQAYGLVGVQRDIMLEVARAYYLRRQIALRLLLRPSDDPLANLANQIRVDELTAILDVLSDGWFSRESNRLMREYRANEARAQAKNQRRGSTYRVRAQAKPQLRMQTRPSQPSSTTTPPR